MGLEVPQTVLEAGLADLRELPAGDAQGGVRGPADPEARSSRKTVLSVWKSRPAVPLRMLRLLKLSLLFRPLIIRAAFPASQREGGFVLQWVRHADRGRHPRRPGRPTPARAPAPPAR